MIQALNREPAVGIEPTTARLRIGCSTTELRWRVVRPTCSCPGADSNRDAFRHHPLKMACLPISPPGPNEGTGKRRTTGAAAGNREPKLLVETRFPVPCSRLSTGLTGLEPATSGVTDRHSNQAELQPPTTRAPPNNSEHLTRPRHSPNGNRTRLSTLKGSRPDR